MGRKTRLLQTGLAVWDVLTWAVAAVALVMTRYSFVLTELQMNTVLAYASAAMALQLIVGYGTKLYRGRYSIASFEEATLLALTVLSIGAGLAVLFAFFAPPAYPRVITFTVPFVALILMAAGRFVARAILRPSRNDKDAEPVLVYGAGNAGQQFGRLLEFDPDAPYQIVGFIDDDPTRKNLHIAGAKVLGTREQLVDLARERGAKKIIVAIPTADRQFMREISAIADEADLDVLVMPPTREIVSGRVQLSNLHQLDVTDLLGRAQIKTNLTEIADYLSGKVVLVTGAGGSIGSEIARQVHRFGPKELVMLVVAVWLPINRCWMKH